jgi:hypothetical protein
MSSDKPPAQRGIAHIADINASNNDGLGADIHVNTAQTDFSITGGRFVNNKGGGLKITLGSAPIQELSTGTKSSGKRWYEKPIWFHPITKTVLYVLGVLIAGGAVFYLGWK